MLSLSSTLLLVLALTAMVGVLVGYAVARLLGSDRETSSVFALEQQHAESEREAAAQLDVLATKLERERDGADRERLRWQEQQAVRNARQKALESEARVLQNRIESLLAEQRGTEERLMSVEQRYAALRDEICLAQRDRGVSASASAPAAISEQVVSTSHRATVVPQEMSVIDDSALDVVLPVLNRRARSTSASLPRSANLASHPASKASSSQSSNHSSNHSSKAYGELEMLSWDEVIPELEEAELPEAVAFDDIVFDNSVDER